MKTFAYTCNACDVIRARREKSHSLHTMSKRSAATDVIEPPRIADSLKHVATLPGGHLEDEIRYEGLELTGTQLRSQRAARAIVVACYLRSVSLADSVLDAASLA